MTTRNNFTKLKPEFFAKFLFFSALLFSHIGIAQIDKVSQKQNSDAEFALLIKDSIFGPTNINKGFGNVRELKIDKYLKEENSAWYKFIISKDTILTFDIVPLSTEDDYDFAIFKCDTDFCANNIRNGNIKPLRICFSQNFSKASATGLSIYSKNDFVGAGEGSSYGAAIKAKKGDVYYLLVDYYFLYPNRFPKGFVIYFYDSWPDKKPTILTNVEFDNNKAILSEKSIEQLDKLTLTLKSNPALNIEIRGHTDSSGDETKNLLLSEKRAKAVAEYLISKGISANRVLYKGCGSSMPIVKNDSEINRKKNRRVDFIYIMK
jgi:outer membrane protein OmpA-like peptidoglycan-associated protein